MKKIRSCRGVETTLSRGRIFTIFDVSLKNIVMSDSEKIKELVTEVAALSDQVTARFDGQTSAPPILARSATTPGRCL